MIKLRDVSLRRGTKHLFAAVTLELASGLRVGVVGQNGCGKSSLLQALTGELAPERGEIYVPRDYAIAVVRQDFPSGSETVMEFIRSGDRELLEVESALEQSSDGSTIAVLHARLADIGGYSADARAAKLAAGLGFGPGNLSRPIREFSGGWQRRLCLAQALMCRSDLLLLDEPTNHLDFETVVWLESWLGRYPGTLIVISHDREFLDNVVGQVIHIEGGRVRAYRGNYSDFERLRAERLTHQSALHRRQQQEIAHITRFVSRFREGYEGASGSEPAQGSRAHATHCSGPLGRGAPLRIPRTGKASESAPQLACGERRLWRKPGHSRRAFDAFA